MVNFSAGVKMFVMAKGDAELAKGVYTLRAKGVRILIRDITLNALKLTPLDLCGVQAGEVVRSGVAEVARLQGMGYVYSKT